MGSGRLSERNATIAAMLSDGEQIKNFYRFIVQNPHINLRDASQIITKRPNATVCFAFNEWNAMGRRVTKGRKGIAYYDYDGYKQFVFDANDTHGDSRYQRPILPMKRLLAGLDELNGTNLADDERGDYRKIKTGVHRYLNERGELTGEDIRDGLMIEGIAYSLYSKTGFPKSAGIRLSGLPYTYAENAELVKEIYIQTAALAQEIEDAYDRKQSEVKVIDDVDEETVSDEPVIAERADEDNVKQIVAINSASRSFYKGYVALIKYPNAMLHDFSVSEIYLGKNENYDDHGYYDNTDKSLIFVSNNPKMFSFIRDSHWVVSQQEFIESGDFTEQDYKEFYELKNGLLKSLETTGEILFSVDLDDPNSGVPFRYPNWQDEQVIKQAKQPKVTPYYQRYLDAQKKQPDAVVLMRLGDFYEIMGENAKAVSSEMDLTLTGREVGLSERVPMCGMPYHAMDRYLEKILERHSVLLVDGDEEPKYILSHSELRERQDEKSKPKIIALDDDEPSPFDSDQSEIDSSDEEDFSADDEHISEKEQEKPQEEVQSTRKKREKGIKDRKRKQKPQVSLFDLIEEPKEKSAEEALIERQLKYGSGVEHGKFRIFDKYNENPPAKTFAEFLKNEYGWGGHGGWNGDDEMHDGKGITMSVRGAKGETIIEVSLKWLEIAVRIADLIDDDNYLSEQEKKEYVEYRVEQNRLRELRAEEERQKNEHINKFILSASDDRKQRILDEYAVTAKIVDFAEFLKNEYGTAKETGETYSITYNEMGVWMFKNGDENDYRNRIYLKWEEFADKVCSLIENDRYIEQRELKEVQPPQDLDAEKDDDWDRLIDTGIINLVEPTPEIDGQRFNGIELDKEQSGGENTDLSSVLDQSELGGAKARFKGNVAAIRLVNELYAENRNPTAEERKILAQFVGWGGLSQAFDEHNASWKKEYAELKNLLSTEDYEQAKGSTLNAYYTAKDVIGGIYSALNRFGVKGNNRILEPSMGTGNFFGFMPKEISDGSRLYGVELDNLTGRIAAKLYPQANVQIKGFEDTTFPNDKFDIVVGNVPFGGYGVADSDYNRYNFKVHDYFLAKSIDKVKPNGIVAIITSKGTMDKLNPSARKYVAERAELLGAIRLPNTAFKQTAGTEAVADILFFRKYANKINVDAENTEWLSTGKTAEGYEINQYFINHPEMVLGTLAEEHGLYGAIDVTVKPDGRELSSALNEAIENLPQAFYVTPDIPPDADEMTEADYAVKPLCYKADGGRLYMRVGEEMIEQPIPKTPKDAYQRIRGMIALREELHHILDIQIQGCSDETLQHEQAQLNAMYDRYVRQYGNLNSQTNVRLFKEDGDSALLFACEDVDKETKEIRKSDVFTKRTIRPYVVPTSTDDPFEALQISKNERGGVDISYIEELTGKDYETVLTELGDSVFRDPEKANKEDKYSGFVTSEEYLSGQVVTKLRAAKEYAADSPEYQRNVAALEQVQPTQITASEISVRLGASWIDKEYYKQFYLELIDAPRYYEDEVEMFYNPHDSSWRLDQSNRIRTYTQMNQRKVYGTNRAPAYRLFMESMNLKTVTIYDTIEEDGREKRVVNQAETIAAREKQNKIKEAFADWIFKDPERREELENAYNRLFNRIRLPKYDGSYLKFPEMNPAIELRPHQKDAVHRIIISDGSTLLHHVVGSGKTYTGIAAIMKMRQLGLCKKAMVPVPNHLVQQWANDWRKLYPNANILVATKEDLEKDNRQKFISKVALGDWDGIIIAQSSFAKINISPERQIAKLQEEIRNVELTIERQWEENGKPRGAVKNLEQIKKSKQVQLKKLMADEKKDNVLTFESLGVDYLFVDEAHYYKNLFLFSKMNNVAGIPNAASQRATDLKLKCEYLQELHGSDRGAIFATGTPISNSMTEMYTMQSYLQPTVLKELGLNFFDAWAADFGETTTSMELTPSGQGYRARTRFSRFTNLPELQTLYRSFADVQTADMVRLDVPEAEKKVITLKPSDTIVELAESIAARADKIYNGGVDSSVDNMLKVTSDGKKLALDPRCFVPTSADEEGSKLNECARRIYEIWESTAEEKSTQIVFCDLSTPKNKFEDYIYGQDFDVYNDLKYKLVQKGIPAEEIAFIHDATTDESKQALFDKINDGKVRVIMGSTEKCGAGTNVQKRLIALHHLDAPYRPSDMEQREGRIIRQGNTNRKVQIYTYVTERTFDSYSYQILENKQRFISQICKGNFTARAFEDMDETTLSYAEIKALTAANPKIKRKMEVDTEILRLRVLEGQYKKNKYELEDKIRKGYPEEIRQQELLIERVTEDLARFKENKPQTPEAFVINVDGKVYTDRKEGGKALTDALYKSKTGTDVAEYCGFKVCMNPISLLSNEREITLSAQGQYVINIGESASGNLTRIDNFLEDFPDRKERLEKKLQQLKNNMAIAQEQVVKQFEHAEQLSLLLSEQAELNAELNLDKREEVVIGDESDGDEEEHYRALPTQKEVDIIDKEDKVAAMETEVLPDYTVTQTDMHKYGYTWDGMLPLSRTTALRLWGMGLEVHKLFPNDTEIIVEDYGEMNPHEMNLYGIEKPIWKNFLNNEKSAAYLTARQHVASAAWDTVTEEMTDVEEGVKGKFSDECFRERAALENYLPHKNPPENEELKNCLPQVLEEFTQRLWDDDLQYYGWTETDVYQSIVGHLPNELQGVTMEQNKEIDYEKEVVESVKAEFEEYKQNLLGKSPEDIFYDNYKIHVFTELKDIILEGTGNGEYNGYLSKEHYKALYEERGGILDGLYEDFIGDEFASVNSGTDTAEFIKSYCEHYHADVMYPAIYYGKDTGNTAYYQFQRALSLDTLPDITEHADSYTVAAPNSFISKDDLEKKNIFFLKIGRDITEDELKDTETAISNMQTAKHKVVKARRDEYIAVLNLHTECRNDIDKAISENYDGMHLKQGFEDELIAKYGVDEINYVLANTVQFFSNDGRFSFDNKVWANGIEITENEGHRYQFASKTHRAVLDGFIDRMRKKQRELLYSNKREEYYSVMKDTVNGKVEYTPVYVDATTGEIGTLFNRSFDTEKEIDELIAKVNTATDVPREYRLVYITPEELRIKSDEIKKTNAVKSLQGAYLNETKQGFKVVNITKDEYERNIAILYRQNVNDYIVAARYDTSDGTWAQGEYLSSLEEAEQYRKDKYGDRPYFYENKEGKKLAENEKNKWVEIYVSKDAVIKKYDKSTFMRMPATNREYSEYTYNIYNNRIKESRQIVDAQGDERELCYKISLKENETVLLKTRDGDEAELTAQEFRELVNHTFDKDYERKQSGNRVRIDLPQEAIIKEYDKTTLMMMPTSSKYQGYSYYLPNSVIHENTEKEDGSIYASLGEDFTVTLKKDKEEIKLTAKEYADLVNGKTADSYKRTPTAMDEYREQESGDDWKTVEISENAVIANYEKSVLLKMPKGQYEGLVYYLPNSMVRKEEDELVLRIPVDFEVHLKDGANGKTVDITAEEFIVELFGKTDKDYENIYRRPSEEAVKRFERIEGKLRKNAPEEMLNKPNWVVVRTRENNDTGRLDKFLIDVHTGKFAESDNPETWTDFDTACKYAKENGGVALAYALDGKDGIACIDLDGCMQENGDFSETANDVFDAVHGSYTEKSISGKGLHIFGKTKGADLRSFSKDKTMEYYQGGHFIAVTGDYYGSSELKSFDTPEMKSLLESKLEKRTEWKNTGKGIEGLSSMDDREILDKAFSAKNGDMVKRLYNGEDIRNNHSNSDMSLMNYLAFWSNHDIDQMLRVFSTSGLYRPDKPQSYYEHTAIKAVKGTPCYTPPKASGNKPSGSGNSSGKGGK